MKLRICIVVATLFVASIAAGEVERPGSAGMSFAARAARRFPQPVRIGDLIHRAVLQPSESRTLLGHVAQIVRSTDGTLAAVVDYGGLFGVGSRRIAVPIDAMALIGKDMEVVDLTPKELGSFPTFSQAGRASIVGDDDTIRVGLIGPIH